LHAASDELFGRLVAGDAAIRLGGRDLAELGGGEVAGAVGIAFQEPFLFSTSVADNIRLERPHQDGVVEASRLAQADEFVARLPEGYDTVVGERGATLSGGQRQRVALARAFVVAVFAPARLGDRHSRGAGPARAFGAARGLVL
jgi:ATP-binding cassette subfamily B protein